MLKTSRNSLSVSKKQVNLFQRMEKQVQRITKKIQAVKQQFCKKDYHSAHKSSQKSQGHNHTSSNYTTARINQQGKNYDFIRVDEKECLKRESSLNYSNNKSRIPFSYYNQKKTPQRVKVIEEQDYNTVRHSNYRINQQRNSKNTQKVRKSFFLAQKRDEERYQQQINQTDLIRKLQQENLNLHQQVQTMESICSERRYKLGYMRAYYRENCRKLQMEQKQLLNQNVYCGYLLQFYRSKAKDFKRRLCNTSQISD